MGNIAYPGLCTIMGNTVYPEPLLNTGTEVTKEDAELWVDVVTDELELRVDPAMGDSELWFWVDTAIGVWFDMAMGDAEFWVDTGMGDAELWVDTGMGDAELWFDTRTGDSELSVDTGIGDFELWFGTISGGTKFTSDTATGNSELWLDMAMRDAEL